MKIKQYALVSICLFTSQLFAQSLIMQPSLYNYLSSTIKNYSDGSITRLTIQDTNFVITNYLIKKDTAGNVIYTKTGGFVDFAQHTDGSMVILKNNNNGGTTQSVIERIDANGNSLWTKIVSGTNTGVEQVLINQQGQIFVTAAKSTSINSTGYIQFALLGFDISGTHIFTKSFDDPFLNLEHNFTRCIIAQNGDFVGLLDIMGNSNTKKAGIGMVRMSPQGVLKVARYWDFLSNFQRLSINGLAEAPNGDFYFGARLMTDQISVKSNTMWLCKTDSMGTEILQKTWHGGAEVGEQLSGLLFTNNKLYAYVRLVDWNALTVEKSQLAMIVEVNTTTLVAMGQKSLEIGVLNEDPYGNSPNALGIGAGGNLVAIGGFYCLADSRYLPFQMELSPTLISSCPAIETTFALTDSVTTYPTSTYVPSGTFSITISNATSMISLTTIATFATQDLCLGCAQNTQSIAEFGHSNLLLYPNPSSDFVTIVNQGNTSVSNYDVVAFNLLGQQVFERKNAQLPVLVDMKSLPTGSYIFVITDVQTSVQYQQKVIKN